MAKYFFFRMGSFTSMPKIRPAPNSEDTDVDYGNIGERVGLEGFLAKCRNQLGSLPPLIPRNIRHRKNSLGNEGSISFKYLIQITIKINAKYLCKFVKLDAFLFVNKIFLESSYILTFLELRK